LASDPRDPGADRSDRELGGVVGDADADPAGIGGGIVDAMWNDPSLSGSLPLMMPGGSNHRCRDFYTWELRRGQPIQERS
jgi:hypothetical protein